MNWISSFFSWLGSFFGSSTGDPVKVAAIQAAAVKACGFLPMTESVIALLATGNMAVATAAQIAAKICGVIRSRPVALVATDDMSSVVIGEINGVPIQGVFVGKG